MKKNQLSRMILPIFAAVTLTILLGLVISAGAQDNPSPLPSVSESPSVPPGARPTVTVTPLQTTPLPTATITPLPSASTSGTQPQTTNTVTPTPSPSPTRTQAETTNTVTPSPTP